jgi:hypothetical protein
VVAVGVRGGELAVVIRPRLAETVPA